MLVVSVRRGGSLAFAIDFVLKRQAATSIPTGQPTGSNVSAPMPHGTAVEGAQRNPQSVS